MVVVVIRPAHLVVIIDYGGEDGDCGDQFSPPGGNGDNCGDSDDDGVLISLPDGNSDCDNDDSGDNGGDQSSPPAKNH